jgi:hypothetical protein
MGRRRTGANHSRVLRTILIAAAISLACCAPQPKKKETVPGADTKVRILQFYPRDPVIPSGEKGMLCYGVENAKKVRLLPAVEAVWPALTRCFEIAPLQQITYTLMAEGDDGQEVTKSVTVKIGAPRVRIIEVSVNSLDVQAGEQVSVCYKVKNAASVTVVPGRLLNTGIETPEHRCFIDKPQRTTLYTVTAVGVGGDRDTERVTVRVR